MTVITHHIYLAVGFDFREKNRVFLGSIVGQVYFQSPTLPLYCEGKVMKTSFPKNLACEQAPVGDSRVPLARSPNFFPTPLGACQQAIKKLRVRIKDNKNSPHGKFHRFLFPFSSKFSDLNFALYVLYNLPVLCHVSQTVSLGYLCFRYLH